MAVCLGKWVEEAEDVVRRERRLLDVVSGKAHPVGAADLIGLADVAVMTRRWRLAVTWIEAALESDPKLGAGRASGSSRGRARQSRRRL